MGILKKFYGRPDAQNLVWQAGTKVMNPTISDDFLAEEFEADPASAEAEYNANLGPILRAMFHVKSSTLQLSLADLSFRLCLALVTLGLWIRPAGQLTV